MKSNRSIILFTSSYPYGKGEQFLKNELKFLSDFFSEIEIFPLKFGKSKKERLTPENVKVHKPILGDNSFKSRLNLKTIINPAIEYKYFKNHFPTELSFKKLRSYFSAISIANRVLANLKVKQVLQALNVNDLIYFYWGNGSSFVTPFLKNIKAKKIIRLHGTDLYENLHNNYFPLRKEQLKNADLILLISDNGKNYINKKYPFCKNKLKISRLGTLNKEKIEHLVSNKSVFRIVSCSGLIKIKRVHLLIEMLKYIEYEVEWVHFGDGTLKENIKNKASNLPPNIKVDFKGFVPNPKILEYYANNSVDLFINVSESEGIPVSIMEAISYGIPILATDVGGTSEIVTSQTGILLQKKFEPEEGSSIINKLITKRLVFSKSDIKAFWEQNYNAKNNYQELVNVFFSL